MRKTLLTLSVLLNLGLIVYLIANQADATENGEQKIITPSETNTMQIGETEVVDEKGRVLETVNVVMLGNSITYQGDWQQVLGRDDVFNGGKPGWTTQQLSWVIKDFIIPNRPKICFFKGGINDYTLGITTERISENMKMVLDSIHDVGTRPVYTTTLYQRGATERNRKIDSLNAKMLEFCAMKDYDFVDLRPFLCENGDILEKYVQPDNTHLKPEAYPQWAKAIRPVLSKYLK